MSGHVFIVQGDVRQLAVDAWLLPSSNELSITSSWLEGATAELRARVGPGRRLDIAVPDGWGPDGRRVLRVEGWWDDDLPQTWLANVTRENAPVEWYLEAVDQFVDLAHRAVEPPRHRDRPLLALPVVGTGGGGAARQRGDVIGQLVERLDHLSHRHQVDVVLVTNDARSFAAAQGARRSRIASFDDARRAWPDLSESLVQRARELAAEATSGSLVLFIGAGVSASAGLPLWPELLARLAERAGLDADQRTAIARLHVLDQARLIENRLEQRGEQLSSAVLDEFQARRYGLSHALLACLPIEQAVTTNYDQLYEVAAAAADRPVAVLPNEATKGRSRWLLKLHGSVDDPESIVLTRQDVLRYAQHRAALSGIVQALLITRRMLFVGFSMSDDNFHRIADDVRRSLQSRPQEAGTFGTSLLLSPDPMLSELWGRDVDIVPIGTRTDTPAQAARRMEVFLDCVLAFATDNTAHLLDPDFAGLLDADDVELRGALINLWKASEGRSRAWGPVREFLRRFGATFDE